MTLRFIDAASDPWRHTGPDAPQQPEPALLLERDRWRHWRQRWPAELPVGVIWPNDADIRELLPDLERLRVVALVFPQWTDGRAYSQARLLRGRGHWRGELRATGDVIADMAPLLWRCGFDSAQLRAGESLAVARRALATFDAYYQPDVRYIPEANRV